MVHQMLKQIGCFPNYLEKKLWGENEEKKNERNHLMDFFKNDSGLLNK